MRDSATSTIGRSHGPVHSGSGDQLNFQILDAAYLRLGARGTDPRKVAADDLDRLHQRFVHPRRFSQARARLGESGTVALTGRPGAGRRTAALMLLHEVCDGAAVHEIDPSYEDDGPALETEAVGERDSLLLDLSGCDQPAFLRVQRELSGFRAVTADRGARLVVVLPRQPESVLRHELLPLTVEIGRPRPDLVLKRHLRLSGIIPSLDEISADALAEHLTGASMGDVARLADLVLRKRDAMGSAGGFAQWCAEALKEVTDHAERVADDVAALEGGRQRALTLALAMFHGAAPDTVFHAASRLLSEVNHPKDERPRLDQGDFTAELDGIKAAVAPDGRVRFGTPGYDRAVRTHFWTYFPDLRRAFRRWIAACVQELGLDAEDRSALITRFAAQCLGGGQPDELLHLVQQWSRGASWYRLVPDATQALAEGLRDDRHGREFRRTILAWSSLDGLPRGQRHVLVLVCSRVMAEHHPEQALVRLHHLARRGPGDERPSALAALVALAAGDGRLCRRLLERLDPGSVPADGPVFLALADVVCRERNLHTGPVIRARMTDRWAAVLEHTPDQEWRPHAARWLDAAHAAPSHRTPLLETLARAAARLPRAAGQLYVVSQSWAQVPDAGREERRGTADLLRRKLDAAQGIVFRAGASPASATPTSA